MDRDTLDSLDKETLIRLILSQAEAIERLTREVEAHADSDLVNQVLEVTMEDDSLHVRRYRLPP
jgi:hypothetical protein